ncbi:MAG: hypothetical protein COV76_02430, partial [Candidatus Omnitrophica bacterium CG11_big_fil_rev_8_21_14_0_20_64_10]
MPDEALAVGAEEVGRGLLLLRVAEGAAPAPAAVQLVGIANRVAGLMPQQLHAPFLSLPLGFQHELLLQPGQDRVGEVKGDADHRLILGGHPFLGEITAGAEQEPLGGQLGVQLLDAAGQPGPLNPDRQFPEPEPEQLLFREGVEIRAVGGLAHP